MSKRTSPLDSVTVAAPCHVGWDNMVGTERVRFCGQCSLNVYNLTAMTKREAEHLISQTEGRLCIRYYRRTDGTILTKNCPVGLRALKRRVKRITGAVISAALSFCAGLLAVTGLRESAQMLKTTKSTVSRSEETLPKLDARPMMGVVAAPDVLGSRTIGTPEFVEGKAVLTRTTVGRILRR